MSCTGAANQVFTWNGNMLVAKHSKKCVDIQNGSTSTGARVDQLTCKSLAQQRFVVR